MNAITEAISTLVAGEQMGGTDERYVRVADVANQHSVHEDTVRRWIVSNDVPVRRIGNRIRIPISYAQKFGEPR